MKKVIRVGVYAIAIQDEAILLITKGGTDSNRDKLDLPGGGIEFGESSEEALRREFLEEVGMRFTSMRLVDNISFTMDILDAKPPLAFHQIGQIYQVYGWEDVPKAQPEHEFDWYPLEKLKASQLTPLADIMVQRLRSASGEPATPLLN